ncbi:SpoIID/LytB domain-containing protein [Pseudoflavonifractor capillosus]|uniref:SpoIID/LytB domain-containing protein n=1 Tax=Pseudoflavonifractor capillosus TaxID=106588 RepID=UPI0019580680|nr:SpoIID/LytB domain-containing protein [Pseudoflavonifractor capillosus]MBM6679521.1 SpoIID/LytB domain-containing protein [Pseudoflavonifractor capillosus]
MRRFFMQFAAVLLAVVLALPTVLAAGSGGEMVRVGLAYGSGALVNANLENNTGYGSGYRMGYFDDDLDFVELAWTDEDETQITMVKTQNTWVNGTSYSNSDNGGDVIGCYHVLVESGYRSYKQAAADAQEYRDGFVAWIDGDYQVRAGSYTSRQEAEDAAQSLGGTVAGTSSYAVNVTRTGTAEILFQFDGGDDLALGVMPDVTGADTVRTWFKGYRYYGGFRYERIGGGDLTVVNIVDLETYIKGVVPYEMSSSWPLEALKVQAVCARSYAYINIHSGKHTSYHFDVCNTTDCQAYYGAGTNSSSYQATERTDRAVDETAGEYAWYDGQVIEAFYSSSHGGASESVYNVWGTSLEQYPYLCGVEDPYEADMASKNSYSSWTVSYTSSELAQRLENYGYDASSGIESLTLTYSDLGNVIQVRVNYRDGGSDTIRPSSMRSVFGISSIRFTVNGQAASSGSGTTSSSGGGLTANGSTSLDSQGTYTVISGSGSLSQAGLDGLYAISGSGSITPAEDAASGGGSGTDTPIGTQVTVSGSSYSFQGSGNGHQLGLSQYGAWAMAERGFTYDEIIEFYYPGTYVR